MLLGRIEKAHLDLRVGYLSVVRPKVQMLSLIPWGLRGDESPETSRVLIEEILKSLRRGESDVAVLSFVDANSPICKAATELTDSWRRGFQASQSVHWRMDLPSDIEGVFARLSGDHRGQLRRKAKKLVAKFGNDVRVVCLGEMPDVGCIMRDVEAVAQKTYQRGLGVGFCVSDEVRNRLQLQAAKGWLRAYVLYIQEKPCAFWVGALYGGVFYSDYLGHDPDYDEHSVGSYLTLKTLEALCQAGAKRVDFGPGDSRYKQQFGTSKCEETTVCIFASTMKGVTLNLGQTVFGFTDAVLKKALQCTQLLPKVKRLWRRRAAHSAVPSGGSAET
jgi:hypothetical protein